MVGILIGLYLQISIVFLIILLFILGIISFLLNKKIIFFLIILLISCIYVTILDKNFEEKYVNISEEVNGKAIIISEPKDKDYKYTYTIKVEILNENEKYKNTKLLLDINKSDLKGEVLSFGNEIEFIGEWKRPSKARNYKGFNYAQYLKSKNIYGTVELEEYEIISNNKVDAFSNMLHSVQNSIKNNMSTILDKEEAALCIGILIGDRENISDTTEDNFKKSNLTHMLAVSGSHITYIITALAIVLSKAGAKFSKIITIIILIIFMALTGFTSSVIRACIMGILVLLSSLFYRKTDTINNLGISSLILLVCNPYAIFDIGFLLSYGGTIGIVLLGDIITDVMYKALMKITRGKLNFVESNKENRFINKTIKYIITSFSITISANLIIIPIMAYSFSTVSITFWISNILAAPIMEIVTIFGFLVYFISVVFMPLAQFMGLLLNILVNLLLKIAQYSSLIPGSSIYIKTPYIIECLIYYLILFSIVKHRDRLKSAIEGLLFFTKWRQIKKVSQDRTQFKNWKKVIIEWKKKILAIGIIIVVLFTTVIFIRPKTLHLYFVDVGQGDCTLIKTPTNKSILIDGGGSEFGNFDVGESILLPYLLDRRITTIDYMFISHMDSDHIGGLFAVMENLKVKNIIISKQGKESQNLIKFQEVVKDKKINVIVVKKGDNIIIDNYTYFEILFPEGNLIDENILNNNSIVTMLHSLGLKILFTGDIEKIAEERLCELYIDTNKLNADILKVAHHGSKTSSIAKFLELVTPKVALIGVGENNNFGHPNEEVLERISDLRCKNI